VIYWNKDGNIFGSSISKGEGGRIAVLQTAFADPKIPDFSDRLLEVFNRLAPGENHTIILASRFEGAICMDLNLPNLPHAEMEKALSFELPRHIPVPVEEIVWSYRITGNVHEEGKSSSLAKVRIMAVSRKSWDSAVAEIVDSGIKADSATHPFMVFNTLPDNPEFILDDPNELLKLFPGMPEDVSHDSMHLSGKFSGLEGFLDYSPVQKTGLLVCLLIGEFIINGTASPENIKIAALPDTVRPQRFRLVRYSVAALLIVVLLLGTVLLARNWWDARTRYGRIIAEKQRINAKINEFKQERLKNKKIDELIKKIDETEPGNNEMIQCLFTLSQKLPPSMWITMFSTRDDEMDLTICTMKDQSAQSDLSALNNIPIFSNFSIRSTRRDSDGTLTIFVHIVYQSKFKRQKDKGQE